MRYLERNAYFDNAKVILIFLVVFGHLIQPFISASSELNTLYLCIYTFHMPAFIFFVLFMFGHFIQPFISASLELNTLYLWIYTFHMPAFIFLAGFFAKGSGNKEYIINLAKKLLIPYILFQLLYTGYYFFIGKE